MTVKVLFAVRNECRNFIEEDKYSAKNYLHGILGFLGYFLYYIEKRFQNVPSNPGTRLSLGRFC